MTTEKMIYPQTTAAIMFIVLVVSLVKKTKIQAVKCDTRGQCQSSSTNDPTYIKPMQRVKEYPDEPFIVSNNKLFAMDAVKSCALRKVV